jgi:UDP-N-acetylglucosamine--N-acetylmuramyl-(pentapeptide) pyrophosphoryl-undecaprenol N-acetylglucosamine transferase
MKILISAINGAGLGHVTRSLAVVRRLKKICPDCEFLFLTSSEASGIIWNEGFASVKIPSWVSMERTDLKLNDWQQLNKSIAIATVNSFRPDVLIADSFPFGEYGELAPILSRIGKRIIILDYFPKFLRRLDFQKALSMFNMIIFPFNEGDISLPFTINGPVEWVGSILYESPNDALQKDEARQQLGLSENEDYYFISLGGGGYSTYGKVVEWIYENISGFRDHNFVQALPPLPSQFQYPPKPINLSYVSRFPISEYFNAFTGAISAVGANTSTELIQFGIPTIWTPYPTDLAPDQKWRAQKFFDENLGCQVEHFDSASLRSCIENLLSPEYRNKLRQRLLRQPVANGAINGANAILKYIKSSEKI